jgi:hypothetical protein
MAWTFLEYPWDVMLDDRLLWGQPPAFVRPGNGGGILARNEQPEATAWLASRMRTTTLSDHDVWFEFPGPSCRSDGAKELSLRLPGVDSERSVPYANAPLFNVREWPGRFHGLLTDSLQVLAALLFDERKAARNLFLEKPLAHIIELFHKTSDDDWASRALICEFASDMVTPVEAVVVQPRKILERKHAQVGLDRLQEMDVASLIDYARRPGRTPAVKAGDRQRLMAVVREETVNTLENRVVRDFCRRAQDASIRYVDEECYRCNRCSGSEKDIQSKCLSGRVKQVDAFSRRCEQWLLSATLSSVTPLSVPCRMPNYALLQNTRYVQVWDAYQKLLRQEDVREQTWRWNRRAWTDCVRIRMMETMRTLTYRDRPPDFVASHKPIRVRKEPQDGCWIKSEPFDGPLVFETNGGFTSIYLFNREDVDRAFIDLPLRLALLNADLYWVATSTTWPQVRVVPVWGFVGDNRWQADSAVRELRADCMKGLEAARLSWQMRSDAAQPNAVMLHRLLLVRAASTDAHASIGRVEVFETSSDSRQASAFCKQIAAVLQEMIA